MIIDGKSTVSYSRDDLSHSHAEDADLASGIGTRWIRLNLTYYHDPKIRRSGCAFLWPYLLVLMGEHRGYIPEDYLDPFLIGQDLGLPEDVITTSLERAKAVELLVWGSHEVNVGGRGGPNIRQLEGWTTKNWSSYQPDPRGAGRNRPRDSSDSNKPSRLHNNTKTIQDPPPISPPLEPGTLHEVETLALECIPARGGRGRPLSLDPNSQRVLLELVQKHGKQRVSEILRDCGGAERPVAMLKKRLSSEGGTGARKRNSPPSRDDWRRS